MIDVHDIALAALLHDIGKVMQRAELPLPPGNKFEDRCPYFNNRITHQHVMYTDFFFEDLALKDQYWQSIANLAASHHKSSAYANITDKEKFWLIQCIILGDRISAMWDRQPDEEDQPRGAYKTKPLYSIFNDLSLGSGIGEHRALPLVSRTPGNDNSFPVVADKNSLKVTQYKALYTAFKGEFNNLIKALVDLKSICLPNFVDAVDSLLEKYFWSVPSNTREENPTNSLYYHSRISAGIASALFSYYSRPDADKSELETNLIESDKQIFLLIGGDLSGIQNYIFDLHPEHSRKAAKTLRARSFKVKTLSEIVLQRIVTDLQLTRQNILMNAGGKFTLLAPNTPEVKEYLSKLRCEVDAEFFDQFLGSVSLNLDWSTKICFKDLHSDHFPDTLDRLIRGLEIAKLHKFSAYLKTDSGWEHENFKHQTAVYHSTVCPQCGKRTVADGEELCPCCEQEIKLGEILPKTTHFIIRPGQPSKSVHVSMFEEPWLLEPYEVGSPLKAESFAFCIGEEPESRNLPYPLLPVATSLPLFDKLKPDEQELLQDHTTEIIDPGTLTFDNLALLALRKTADSRYLGVPLNAVLKGDVDNLGTIFKLGFLYATGGKRKPGGFSLTQYATLSSALDWFFSAYLPNLIDADPRYANRIYTVYAGGDDFCLIGPWNVMLDFVIELEKKFRHYVSEHEDIHFSAALSLMHGRSPVRFSIQKSETELHAAKTYPNESNPAKNAIRLFETTVPWQMMERLENWASELLGALSNTDGQGKSGLTTQFLYRLLHYNSMALSYEQKKEARDLLYKSYLAYDLRRNMKDDPRQAARLQELASDDELMKMMRVPIHKVIYSNRKYKTDGGKDEL